MRPMRWLYVPLVGLFAFLYIPILIVIGMSFNSSKLPFAWGGFSTKWYSVLFHDKTVLTGLRNTLVVATVTTVLATILGTLIAIGITRYSNSSILEAYALSSAILPDLALAIGLLAFFKAVHFALGLNSVILSHTIFCMAFVAAVVRGRLTHIDPSLEEAALDLGDTAFGTFWRVTVPSLSPAIIAGALLSFTLSLDEFVIAFFTDGPNTPTLPIVIYSMVRFGVTPEINALAALVVAFSAVVILFAQRKADVVESL